MTRQQWTDLALAAATIAVTLLWVALWTRCGT